jgi:hypothetical protein
MRRVFLLALAVALLLGTTAQTQHRTTFEQITVADTAIGVTAAIYSGLEACRFRLETAQIRWRIDTAPTASVGTLLEVGDVLELSRIEDVQRVRFIRTGTTSGLLNVWCWSRE